LRAFQGHAGLLASNGGTTAPTGEAQL
jgi:hypothetical protein